MKANCRYLPLLFFTLFQGCIGGEVIYKHIYQSPLYTNTNGYKAMPLKVDNKKSSLYAGVTFYNSQFNEVLRDEAWGGSAELHLAHKFGSFQTYYGTQLTIGKYKVNEPLPLGNVQAGFNKFGAWGISGGINYVKTVGDVEWRIIGVEANCQTEWGNYLRFREGLSETSVNLVDKRSHYSTISATSDLIYTYKKRFSIGYKVSAGKVLGNLTYYDENRRASILIPYLYTGTLHFTIKRMTLYSQGGTGYKGGNVLLGLIYRLY